MNLGIHYQPHTVNTKNFAEVRKENTQEQTPGHLTVLSLS